MGSEVRAPRWLVVADDTTGALDSALGFLGVGTVEYHVAPPFDADVVAISTGSRALAAHDGLAVRRTVEAEAARADVAVEIDGDPSRQDIDFMLAGRALAAGCLIALDSDAHATEELAAAETAIAHARLAGVPTDRIINCWELDRLLEWLER